MEQREIKFRAWDKSRNEMYVPHALHIHPETKNFGAIRFNGDFMDDSVLMTYTGLKDKNGKEIYEGDFLKCSVGHEKRIDKPLEVIFANGAFQMDRSDWPYPCAFVSYARDGFEREILLDWDAVSKSLEVIGNKFQNPELLTPLPPMNEPTVKKEELRKEFENHYEQASENESIGDICFEWFYEKLQASEKRFINFELAKKKSLELVEYSERLAERNEGLEELLKAADEVIRLNQIQGEGVNYVKALEHYQTLKSKLTTTSTQGD